MVLLSSTRKGRFLKYHTDALGPNTLLVRKLDGVESISRPYRLELELLSSRGDLDPIPILQTPGYVGIKQSVALSAGSRGIRTLRFHGVLSHFEQGEREGNRDQSWVVYRAALMPRLWKLSLTVHNRIFMEKTVPQIVEEILKANGLTPADYEFLPPGRPPARKEYVVQYQETDLNFISRLLEHEGIFYFFQQLEDREKVVFGDSIGAYAPIAGNDSIPYRPAGQMGNAKVVDWMETEAVLKFAGRTRTIPAEVVLQDYNYRSPSVPLKASAPVAPHGTGTYFEYAPHYKDAGEGKALAQVRAEEFLSREKVFSGVSDCRSLRAGATFQLVDHYREDYNAKYLLTEVRHRAEQTITPGEIGAAMGFYELEFDSIPADRVFRPERATPKPKLAGTVNARVDGAGSAQYAEVDDQGRYKVKIPFDLSDASGGAASRYLRMAQPYAGAEMGMHFPLHKGTEVILTHMNGDPDRPLIAAAVPNPETSSRVSGSNQTQCVIQTGGNNKILFEDQAGNERIKLSTPHANSYLKIGSPNDPTDGISAGTDLDCTFDIKRNYKAEIGGSETEVIRGKSERTVEGTDTDTYKQKVMWTFEDGISEYITGKWVETLKGQNFKFVTPLAVEVLLGAKLGMIAGMKAEMVIGLSAGCILGKKIELVKGSGTSLVYGQKSEMVKGNALKFQVGDAYEAISGNKKVISKGDTTTLQTGDFKHALKMVKFEAKAAMELKTAQTLVTKARECREEARTSRAKYGDRFEETQKQWYQKAKKAIQEARQHLVKAGKSKVKAKTNFNDGNFVVK